MVGVSLALLIPAFAWGAIGLPMHFVTLVSGAGVESATGLAHTVLNTCGAGLLLRVAVARRRMLRGRCARCGGEHQGRGRRRVGPPARLHRVSADRATAYVLLCGLLPWAAVKTAWLFGATRSA